MNEPKEKQAAMLRDLAEQVEKGHLVIENFSYLCGESTQVGTGVTATHTAPLLGVEVKLART